MTSTKDAAPPAAGKNGTITRTMSEWAAALEYDAIAADAVHQAKRYLLDSVGCALGGFLLFNFPPARIFMGDGGSLVLGYATDLRKDGSLLHVSIENGGLRMVDVSNPATPELLGSVYTGSAYGVDRAGDRVYLADGDVQIIDVTVPASPALLGALDPGGYAYDATAAGTLAFVAAGQGGLQILDIADPAAPTLLGTLPTATAAKAVLVAGDTAYVAVAAAGLLIADVSNPATPITLGTLDTPGDARDLALGENGTLYVADTSEGVQIVMAPEFVPLLDAATLDFVELEPGDAQFIFLNPNDATYTPPAHN